MAQRIGEFRGKRLRDFRAWLYVIAANQVNLLIRQKIRDQRLSDSLAEQLCERKPDSPERRWAALYRALLTLNEEQQHLITLRFFQGLSYDEIACIVGKRAGTVRVRIHRALKELRPTLQRLLEDECVREDSHGR
jgi:RNA polymerase sigma factor (sigma-70 family)